MVAKIQEQHQFLDFSAIFRHKEDAMSSFTFADNKLGGRLTAAADAIGAGHLNRAAGILAEIADELNQEATEAGLLAEEAAEIKLPPARQITGDDYVTAPQLATSSAPADLQMCGRGVHSYGDPDSNGWRHCQTCGVVNVAPPDGGAIDMTSRPLGDYA